MFHSFRWILVLVMTFSLTCGLSAQDTDKATEGNGLSEKISNLEKELKEVKEKLKTNKLTDEDLSSLYKKLEQDPKMRGPEKPAVKSTVDIDIYGYLKFDAAYDTDLTSTGNFARWAESSAGRGRDDQYNMTANQTRIGLKFKGPVFENMVTTGKLEMDFYGGGAENKAHPYMRHAYMQLEWPVTKFSIIAGQTWDIISPLNPSTLNYPVLWWCGNLGYRRAQLRVTKVWDCDDSSFKFQGGIFRNIGHDAPFDPGDTGEDSGLPCVQGRASYTFPLCEKKTTLGVSGHYAREEWDYNASRDHKKVNSWSYHFDLSMPLCGCVSGKAEWYSGANMDAYLGGIGQGVIVDNATPEYKEINARGGWFALNFKRPIENWDFNIGSGADHVSTHCLANGARTKNRCTFGNAIFSINKKASVGFELSNWRTHYKNTKNGNSIRSQISFIYKF